MIVLYCPKMPVDQTGVKTERNRVPKPKKKTLSGLPKRGDVLGLMLPLKKIKRRAQIQRVGFSTHSNINRHVYKELKTRELKTWWCTSNWACRIWFPGAENTQRKFRPRKIKNKTCSRRFFLSWNKKTEKRKYFLWIKHYERR